MHKRKKKREKKELNFICIPKMSTTSIPIQWNLNSQTKHKVAEAQKHNDDIAHSNRRNRTNNSNDEAGPTTTMTPSPPFIVNE